MRKITKNQLLKFSVFESIVLTISRKSIEHIWFVLPSRTGSDLELQKNVPLHSKHVFVFHFIFRVHLGFCKLSQKFACAKIGWKNQNWFRFEGINETEIKRSSHFYWNETNLYDNMCFWHGHYHSRIHK